MKNKSQWRLLIQFRMEFFALRCKRLNLSSKIAQVYVFLNLMQLDINKAFDIWNESKNYFRNLITNIENQTEITVLNEPVNSQWLLC